MNLKKLCRTSLKLQRVRDHSDLSENRCGCFLPDLTGFANHSPAGSLDLKIA